MDLHPRWRRLAAAIGLPLVGLVLVFAGLHRERVRCERATGVCVVTSGVPLLERSDEFSVAAVRDTRFDDTPGRRGTRRGAIVLVDSSGREFVFARDAEDRARANFEALRGFFAGQRDAVEFATEPSWWIAAVGLALALAAPWIVLARPPARASAAAAERPRSHTSRAPLIALGVGAAVLAAMAVSMLASRTKGSLALRCTQRCEVDGGTCMPGSEMVLPLAPGEYEVRVFDPAAPTRPKIQRVAVVRGQVTQHECAP